MTDKLVEQRHASHPALTTAIRHLARCVKSRTHRNAKTTLQILGLFPLAKKILDIEHHYLSGPCQSVIGKLRQYRKTRVNLRANLGKPHRMLEIGPGDARIAGFETLDVVDKPHVDYVRDATKTLPFTSDTFELIYASHVLEHVAWYQTEHALKEWIRILKPGGHLELWVPNGLKICKALVDFELRGEDYIHKDGCYLFNEARDPCKWAAARIYTYGDKTGSPNHANWHRALFTPRYLKLVMENAGLRHVRQMDRSEVRGYDHRWINLGMRGTK